MTDDVDVLVVEQVGRTRYRTPENFLYCEGVRIASTKPLLYRADEMHKCRSEHGMVLMDRPAEVLFSEDTIASFNGKDVTDSHPNTLVNPKSWKNTAVGTVLNPRRGLGVDDGYLIADLLIKDENAIRAVERGKVEVSCGYDQDHAEVKPGLGRFTRIIGNHVALVEKGRCGPACAIGDEDKTMAKVTMYDRLRTAFKAKDEIAFDAELDEFRKTADAHAQHVIIELDEGNKKTPVADESNPVLDMLKEMKSSFDAMSARLEKLETKAVDEEKTADEDAADKDKEEKKEECKDADSVNDEETVDAMTLGNLRVSFQDVVAKAEMLSPGIRIPTFDGLGKSKKTIADQMCGLRKAALDGALKDDKRKTFVESVLGSTVDTEKLSCDQMELAFNAASSLARMANNAPRVSMDHMITRQGPMTAARLQEINAEARKVKSA